MDAETGPCGVTSHVCIEPWMTFPDKQTELTIEDMFWATAEGCERLALRNADQLWVVR